MYSSCSWFFSFFLLHNWRLLSKQNVSGACLFICPISEITNLISQTCSFILHYTNDDHLLFLRIVGILFLHGISFISISSTHYQITSTATAAVPAQKKIIIIRQWDKNPVTTMKIGWSKQRQKVKSIFSFSLPITSFPLKSTGILKFKVWEEAWMILELVICMKESTCASHYN